MTFIADILWHFAKWSEATPLGKAIRNSEYAFPMIEFVHLAGLAVIGGAVLIVDMRLLGFGLKKTSVAQLAKDAQPYVTGSLIVMLVTGIMLYSSEATKCYASAAFWSFGSVSPTDARARSRRSARSSTSPASASVR